MVLDMKGNGKIIERMAMESSFMLTAIFMKATGSMIKPMVSELTST